MNKALDYKDIGLISRHVSSIPSRCDIDTSVKFGNLPLRLPLIVSPMPDLGNSKLLNEVRKLGGFGYIHRFQSISNQIAEFQNCGVVGCAIGVVGDYLERFEELYQRGCRHFCIDTANGAHKQVFNATTKIIKLHSDVYLIVGNVASKECFQSVENVVMAYGSTFSGIRVGIGSGSACTTKLATGLEYPMVSTILECKENRHNPCTHIIADGGIKEPMDMCKALAVGADLVMVGGILAGSEEAGGTTIRLNGELYKVFRGAASYSVQQEYSGQEPQFVEGEEKLVRYTGSVEKTIKKFTNGLLSSMSYMNARNLKEYRQNTDWCIL